jgi:hypothetical protein
VILFSFRRWTKSKKQFYRRPFLFVISPASNAPCDLRRNSSASACPMEIKVVLITNYRCKVVFSYRNLDMMSCAILICFRLSYVTKCKSQFKYNIHTLHETWKVDLRVKTVELLTHSVIPFMLIKNAVTTGTWLVHVRKVSSKSCGRSFLTVFSNFASTDSFAI